MQDNETIGLANRDAMNSETSRSRFSRTAIAPFLCPMILWSMRREEINAALVAASMPRDMMTIVFNPVVIRSARQTVLFDTGNGPQLAKATLGRMPESMAAAELIRRQSIAW